MRRRGWPQAAATAGLAARHAKRAARRAAAGLPYESVGQGQPRRSRGGEYVPRGATPLQVAVLEVRNDLMRGYLNPSPNMSRTEYKLRRHEFEIYREGWLTIKQAIEDDVDDLL